jgi:hypothetical protein
MPHCADPFSQTRMIALAVPILGSRRSEAGRANDCLIFLDAALRTCQSIFSDECASIRRFVQLDGGQQPWFQEEIF